jgi:di/tricarboxylate transporter
MIEEYRMSPQTATIVGLVIVFIIGTALPINMGALAFVGAFIVGSLFVHLSAAEIFAGFPGDLFVTLVGITYLFAIAQKNGTIDWLVHRAVWALRGRIAVIPWVMFMTTALLTGVGAVSPGAVAIIAPIALRFAHRYGISPLLMGLMVIHGAQAGGFSPISIYGGITNQIVQRAGVASNEVALFLSSFAVNTAIALALYFILGGHRATRQLTSATNATGNDQQAGAAAPLRVQVNAPEPQMEHLQLNVHRSLTLVGLVALGVGSLVFDLNVGLVAISVAVALALLAPHEQKGAVDQISWSTVLLITGVISYIAVLQKSGAVDLVANSVTAIGAPLLGALLLCYIGGVVSAFASSVAVLGATIPLAVPFLMQGHVDPVGMIAALAISTTIVDVSPFSTNGALVVANVQGIDKDSFYRQVLLYSALVVVLGPLLVWLALVLPGWHL